MLIISLLASVVGFVLSQILVFVQISTTYTAFQQHRTVLSLLSTALRQNDRTMKKTVKTPVLLTKDHYLYLNHPQNRDRHAFRELDRPALFAICSIWVKRVSRVTKASRVENF